ncbi:MAG: uroporphyrinogen decarboxylase family protein [Candidatus Brocadiia bacterium]
MNEDLTHRERVLLALEHRETDRIPIAMVCSGINAPARAELEQYLARERGVTVEEYLRPLIDIRNVGPAYVGPPLQERTDWWGVRRRPVSYGSGAYDEIEYYPLAEAESPDDLDAHRWPTTEWFDYSVLPDHIAAARAEADYCLMAQNGNIFESSWYMRGFERMLMDLALNPELAHAIMGRVCDFYVEHFRRVLETADGGIDLVFTADDIGGQQGLLMSLSMWEEHIKPYHARMNRAIHEFGARVIYHTDGAVMEAVPGLIDMGVDVLQALQFDAAGMDPVALKENFGDRLCFEGGVSVQHTLPHGTPHDVRREVRERIDVLGEDGGYILGPSHAIQAGTPPENIVALFDTAASHYPPRGTEARGAAQTGS